MDISSTTSQVSASAETTTSAQTQKSSSKNDSSFKDEMNKVTDKSETKDSTKSAKDKNSNVEEKNENDAVAVKTEEKYNNAIKAVSVKTEEKYNNAVAVKTEEKYNNAIKAFAENEIDKISDLNQSVLLSGEINMSGVQSVNADINLQAQVLLNANVMLSEVVSDAKTPVKVDYTTITMDMNDTQFFTDLVQNQDKTIQNVVTELTQNPDADVQEIQKNVKVSATLMNALSEAVKNKQSFRIDFDKDISVIIRVDRDGAITAKFIPGDSAVEQYLKQNISTLRQRFDEQELAYNELSYTGQQKRNRKNNNDNKENGHE